MENLFTELGVCWLQGTMKGTYSSLNKHWLLFLPNQRTGGRLLFGINSMRTSLCAVIFSFASWSDPAPVPASSTTCQFTSGLKGNSHKRKVIS